MNLTIGNLPKFNQNAIKSISIPVFCAKRKNNTDTFTMSASQQKYQKVKWMCSREKDENGKLKSGLTRPLSLPDARRLNEFEMDRDIDTVNYYIWLKDTKGLDFYDACDYAYARTKSGDETSHQYDLEKQCNLDSKTAKEFSKNGNYEKIIDNKDRFLELTGLSDDACENKSLLRNLTPDEAILTIDNGLNDKRVNKFIIYMTSGIEPEEAAYQASFMSINYSE